MQKDPFCSDFLFPHIRADQTELFRLSASRQTNGIIIPRPEAVAVVQYCNKYASKPPWYVSYQEYLINGGGGEYDYPDVPPMSRKLLQEFLR